ncbi:hypothetical protein JTB14_009276 [Gonioctena quinquepunctata]|nr:hypothetical protein JTB14_009276 [Gonioctena quinquepunctata]
MNFSGNSAENWKLWRQKFENYLVASEANKKDEKVQIAQQEGFIGSLEVQAVGCYQNYKSPWESEAVFQQKRRPTQLNTQTREQLSGPSRNRQDSDSRRQSASRRIEMSRGRMPEKNGSVHGKNQCPAFGRQYRTCGFKNHFGKVCRKKNINQVEVESSEEEENCVYVYSLAKETELYIDDVIVHRRAKEEHDRRLFQVFEKARKYNVTFDKEKC